MTGNDIDDETLMAYADGELGDQGAARVEAALRDDPDLAGRLALFARTGDVLKAAADIRRAEPVPDHVLARAQATIADAQRNGAGNVVPLTRAGRRPALWPTAIAASLAAVGFIGGYLLAPQEPGAVPQELRLAILDTPGVSAALDRVPAGERAPVSGGEITLIASFRDAEDRLCREFELDAENATTLVSVACRSGDQWEPSLAIVGASDDGTQFAPASSLETLDAYLTAIGAGPTLSLEEEASALAAID